MFINKSKDPIQVMIDGCIQNERKHQQALYNLYFDKMIAVCKRYTDDETEALSILNNGFLKVYKNISAFKNEGSFEGWVRKIIYHSVADHFRNKSNKLSFIIPYEDIDEMKSNTEISDEFYKEDILKILDSLPKISSRALFLYAIEGYSHKEIGVILGMNENTSKWHVAKARNLLKSKLSGEYPTKSISKQS